MTDVAVPDSLACDAFRYEGDIAGFVDHIVNDHRVPADYLRFLRGAVDQGTWLKVERVHTRILMGHYVPRHRLPGVPLTDLSTPYEATHRGEPRGDEA